MLKRYRENVIFRHIFWITVIYIAAHWFLLVSTGRWWDDWCYADHNAELTMEVFIQSSLPLAGIVDILIWYIPYKYFVFVMFYAGGIFLYFILKDIEFFDDRAVFWITAMFMVIPVNDARIMYICFNYSLGLFCFLLAFYLTTKWRKLGGWKMIIVRVISLLILLLGFNAESTMLMVLLILFYLYYKEVKDGWKWRNIRQNIKKLLKATLHYIDFLITPIAYYFGVKILFPAYGVYGGHGYIPWNALPEIILKSPIYAAGTLINILQNYKNAFWSSLHIGNIAFAVLGGVIVAYAIIVVRFYKEKGKDWEENNTIRTFGINIFLLTLGILTFYIGLFPYLTKRADAIPSTMEGGRDSLLLAAGCAILIYYGIQIFLNNWIRKLIMFFVVILGIIHFNFAYTTWEERWYQQLQLMDEIANNQEILDNDTFIVIYNNATVSFYQTNGNSWATTGEQSRYFLKGVDQIKFLLDPDTCIYLNMDGYMMNDYDSSDTTIDGVIYVNYEDVSTAAVLKGKWYEIFNPDVFQNWIKEQKEIAYYSVSKEMSDNIIQAYLDGVLTDDNLINYVEPVQ